MGRLTKAELKKIFIRPSIFVMLGFLALFLIVSVLLFNPKENQSTYISSVKNDNISTIFSYFYAEDASERYSYSKYAADRIITQAESNITFFENKSETEETISTVQKLLDSEIVNTQEKLDNFIEKATEAVHPDLLLDVQVAHKRMLEALTSLNSAFTKVSNMPYIGFFLDSKDYTAVTSSIKTFIDYVTITDTNKVNDIKTYQILKENIKAQNFFIEIETNIDNITYAKLSESVVTNLRENYVAVAKNRLAEINTKFVESYNKNLLDQKSEDKQARDQLITYLNEYYHTAQQVKIITNNYIRQDISKEYSDSNFSEFWGYTNYDRYAENQELAKQTYLFSLSDFDFNYANNFSFLKSTNSQTNAYDFMYFVMELFSFAIIIFCVVLGANMIAGEQANGTLKMLAIRPYSRSTILSSKILATMTFVSIFVVFSVIISFIAGLFMFGTTSLPILAVVNASNVFVASPLLMMIIYILLLILRMFVYVIIAFTISTVFKSYVGAVATSITLVFITSVLNVFLSNLAFFKFFPLNNIDLFKYFGGGMFATTSTGQVSIYSIVTSPILPDTNIIFAILYVVAIITILLVLTHQVFKRRDIA